MYSASVGLSSVPVQWQVEFLLFFVEDGSHEGMPKASFLWVTSWLGVSRWVHPQQCPSL